MFDVAGGKRGVVSDGDAGDECIANVNRTTVGLALGRQLHGLVCGSHVKNRDAIGQIQLHKFLKLLLQQGLAFPVGEQLEAEAGFEQDDARNPDAFGWLLVQPLDHGNVGLLLHQR
jgi:hypothetical protein